MGIIVLAILASGLQIIFKGSTDALINLFAVGVFMSFTLSQGGMVRHWWRKRHESQNWLRSLIINGTGAGATLIAATVISVTKFLEGAWVVVLLIPLLVVMFTVIHKHYERVERELISDIPINPSNIHRRIIVPVDKLNRFTKTLYLRHSHNCHQIFFHLHLWPHPRHLLVMLQRIKVLAPAIPLLHPILQREAKGLSHYSSPFAGR